jgi:AraC family transcriptional regulator
MTGREFDRPIRSFTGAKAHRAIHTGAMVLEPHAHHWPCLAIHLLGRYREQSEDGGRDIAGPAVVFHPAGESHGEWFDDDGAEVFILQFDPRWMGLAGGEAPDRHRVFRGGLVSAQARSLAACWMDDRVQEAQLARATAMMLKALRQDGEAAAPPTWLAALAGSAAPETTAAEAAKRWGLHPTWVAHAYRRHVGEGVRETARRRRAEQAVKLLRTTPLPAVEVALASGFCDQSHMARTLQALLGRTPGQVRAEGALS